jgi:hypothetical protein
MSPHPQVPHQSPHGPTPAGIDLGAATPPPASKTGMDQRLKIALAGVAALVVLGGIVLLLLNVNGGGTPGGEEQSPTQTEESAAEDTSPAEEETTPEDDPDQDSGGVDPGDCLLQDCDG